MALSPALWAALGVVAAAAVTVAVGVVLIHRLQAHGRLLRSLTLTLLLVLVSDEKRPESENRGAEGIREEIGAAESLYAALTSTLRESGKWRRFWNGPLVASFEIVAAGGAIAFYLAVPRKLKSVVEKNIYAAYPNAEIRRADDYTVFAPGNAAVVATASLVQPSQMPLQTFRALERDPLNAITSVMHEVQKTGSEGAAVQVVVWPAEEWSKGAQKIASLMQKKGLSFDRARAEAEKSGVGALIADFQKKDGDKNKEPRTLSLRDEEVVKAISAKSSKSSFHVNLRLVASAPARERAETILEHLEGGFAQFSSPSLNSVKFRSTRARGALRDFIFRIPDERATIILNTEELASIYHFPATSTLTPSLRRLEAKMAPAPVDLPEEGELVLGRNMFRGEERAVAFASRQDRRRHLYVIGQTGTGKSSFLQNLIVQDVRRGEGVAVVDPHGDLVEAVMGLVPDDRIDDVVYFDPADLERPMGLNMLEFRTEDQKDFAVQEMVAIFEKLFPPEYIGPMFEHYMRNAMLLLMGDSQNPGTLIEIPRVFTDDAFVASKLRHIADPVVRNFWEREWKQTTGQQRSEMLGYLVSKIGRFAENETMRNIIGQTHSGVDLRTIMDEGKILLLNLSKGRIGEINSSLLGLVVVSKIQMAALGRAAVPSESRKDFYLYVDEFQNFTTNSIATILSEARKYRLNLTIANQFIAQLEESIRDAVFGNVGSMASFRVGPEDAEMMEKHFAPVFSAHDLLNLKNFSAYCRLMVNNKTSRPFSLTTYPPDTGDAARAEAIRLLSRQRYGQNRSTVTEEIIERSQLRGAPEPDPTGIGIRA